MHISISLSDLKLLFHSIVTDYHGVNLGALILIMSRNNKAPTLVSAKRRDCDSTHESIFCTSVF